MRAEKFLPVLLSVVMTMALSSVVQAKEVVKKPDLDFLDYLGTFEAERGKEIDPLLLDSMPAVKPLSIKAKIKKRKTKRNESPKKEEKR